MVVSFLLTKLDQPCSAVLGHRWLARYNLLIDWSQGNIQFRLLFPEPSKLLLDDSSQETLAFRTSKSPVHSNVLPMEQSAIDIVTVNATTFHTLTKQKGATTTVIYVHNTEVMAKSTSAHPASETGINIPSQYHEFLDVFSKPNPQKCRRIVLMISE